MDDPELCAHFIKFSDHWDIALKQCLMKNCYMNDHLLGYFKNRAKITKTGALIHQILHAITFIFSCEFFGNKNQLMLHSQNGSTFKNLKQYGILSEKVALETSMVGLETSHLAPIPASQGIGI